MTGLGDQRLADVAEELGGFVQEPRGIAVLEGGMRGVWGADSPAHRLPEAAGPSVDHGAMTRWLIDGMNVVGSKPDGWWNDPDRAIRRLTRSLDDFARSMGEEVTVVFDRVPRPSPETSQVVVAEARRKGRNAADHEIVAMVGRAEDPAAITVVTSDKWLRQQVEELGARVVSSNRFRKRLDAT
ncbi:MAG: NYN domain-containing protein [Actinomycetota bacterium]